MTAAETASSPQEPHARSLRSEAGRAVRFLLYQAGPVSTLITSLLVWPVLGRELSKTGVGQLSSTLAMASIAAPALCLGLNLYVANRLSNEPGRAGLIEGKLSHAITKILIVSGVLACLVGMLADSVGFSVAGIALGSGAFLLVSGTLRGLNRAWSFGSYTFLIQVLALLALGLLFAATGGLAVPALSYVLIIGTGALFSYLAVGRASRMAEWSGAIVLLRSALRLVPHLILAVALLMAMRILVAGEAGQQALAGYQYASLLIGGVVTVAASLDAHWSIRAQRAESLDALLAILERNQLWIQLCSIVSMVLVVIFSFGVLSVWLPPGYPEEAIRITVLLAIPAGALQAYADGRSAVVMWAGRNGGVSISTTLGVVSALGIAAVLIPLWGWTVCGAAISVGALIRAIAICLFSRPLASRATFSLMPTALAMVQLVVSVALAAIVVAANQ